MRAVFAVALLLVGGCGPGARPSNHTVGPTAPPEVLEKAGTAGEAGEAKTRYCVELTESGEFDCQPSEAKCAEYAVFLEEEGYVVEAATRCQPRTVVCASYQTAEGGEELCGRDQEECEHDRTALLEWDGVVDGSVGPCR